MTRSFRVRCRARVRPGPAGDPGRWRAGRTGTVLIQINASAVRNVHEGPRAGRRTMECLESSAGRVASAARFPAGECGICDMTCADAVMTVPASGGLTGAARCPSHIRPGSGEDDFGESSGTFVQPFPGDTTAKATSDRINTKARNGGTAGEWSVPVNRATGQIRVAGGKPPQLTAGVRCRADSPPGGPQDWGARLVVTYLFLRARRPAHPSDDPANRSGSWR